MDQKVLDKTRRRIDMIGGGPPEDGVYAIEGYDHDGRKLNFNGDPHDCPTGSCAECDLMAKTPEEDDSVR